MEININPKFGEIYIQPEETSTSSFSLNDSQQSTYLSRVGNRDGSCYVNGTREYEGFYSTAQFVTGLIIYPILCIIGIIGNCLSIIVLSHRDMATPTNVYLLALGISDSLKLLNDFLYFIMLIINLSSPGAAETMMVNVYPYAHYIFQIAVCITAWLTVSVAMDRYVSVCHPSRAKSLCTIVRARSMVITVYVVMILLSIPSAFRYRLQTVHDTSHNVTCMELVVTELGRNKEFMIPYTWAQNLLRGIIPVFILIFLNARIINVLRKERVKGKKFSARNRITLMLIMMVLVFILCITPDAIMSTFFGKGYVEEGFMVKGVREITDSLLALNSAVNFILYCSLSNLFRATFVRVFFGKSYIQMRGGSCRQLSTYGIEPTTAGHNGCGGGDSLKRKNSSGKRLSRKGTNSNESAAAGEWRRDSPERKYGSMKENHNGRKPQRNNSLCYTDENDHLYAQVSGVWLGPAPKSVIPKISNVDKTDKNVNIKKPHVACDDTKEIDIENATGNGNCVDDFNDNDEAFELLNMENNILPDLLQFNALETEDDKRCKHNIHNEIDGHNGKPVIIDRISDKLNFDKSPKDGDHKTYFKQPRRCLSAVEIHQDLNSRPISDILPQHTTSMEPLSSGIYLNSTDDLNRC